jgi:hypothetical protein
MGNVFKPFFADSDQLLLAGHVLSSLELGRVRMHAADYFEVSCWMVDLFDRLDVSVLLRLRREGPTPLRLIAENVLNDRGEVDWVPDRTGRIKAECVWRQLRQRMMSASRE